MLITLERSEELPVSVVDAKAALRISDTDQDAFVAQCIWTAVEFAESRTSRVLVLSTKQFRLDGWPCWSPYHRGYPHICIPAMPVRDVISIKYFDADGTEQTIGPANYTWEKTPEGAAICFISGYSLPILQSFRMGAVRVEFEAGYDEPSDTGDDPELILPARFKQAITLMAGHWFEHREEVAAGQTYKVELAAESLLQQLVVYR